MDPAMRHRIVRLALYMVAGGVVVASVLVYGHALQDGTPSVGRSLLPGGAALDAWAPAWAGALGGVLVLSGLARRSALSWAGVAILGVAGAFFFEGLGWAYLGVALLLAAGLATQRPPRRRLTPS